MQATLRALLTGVIDYAGMFPPASLPLEQSIRNYLRYLTEAESWMLGRFICPAAKLHELTPYLQGLDLSRPLLISALGKGGNTVPEFVDNLRKDRDAILAFHEQFQGLADVDIFEVRIPAELTAPGKDAVKVGGREFIPEIRGFVEAPYRPESPELRELLTSHFHDAQTLLVPDLLPSYRSHEVGFKFRCGGTELSDYPSPKDLASVIETCVFGPALKFTAGLHHPIRHFNQASGVAMHGFINVFVAALLHKTHRVPAEPILADEDASHFVFTDTEVRWKDCKLSAEAVRLIRQFRDKVVSFGSCSFDEPRDDLRKLGWLP